MPRRRARNERSDAVLGAQAPDYRLTPADPLWAGAHWHPTPVPPIRSIHLGLEIGVVLRGREEVIFDDGAMGGGPGDVWLCAMSELHELRIGAPHTKNLVFVFLPCFLGDELLDGISWLTFFALPSRRRPRAQDARTRNAILAIAHELEDEVEQQTPGWQFAVRLSLLRLLFTLTRGWTPSARTSALATRGNGLARILPAISLLHGSPAAPLSRAEAARACGLGRSQFTALFRKAMGIGFAAFRRRARTAFAAHLLSTTGRPVEQIAAQAGFSDASHLHRCFLAEYGCTPGQYRDQARPPGAVPPRVES